MKRKKRQKRFNNVFVRDLGVRFRSKFEWRSARWLEKAGIKWEYEPRVKIGDRWCLPDFWLPDYQTFLELRPADLVDERLLEKIRRIKAIYEKETVLCTNIMGVRTFLRRLDEHRKMSAPFKLWVFTGTRGELRDNPPPTQKVGQVCPVTS